MEGVKEALAFDLLIAFIISCLYLFYVFFVKNNKVEEVEVKPVIYDVEPGVYFEIYKDIDMMYRVTLHFNGSSVITYRSVNREYAINQVWHQYKDEFVHKIEIVIEEWID